MSNEQFLRQIVSLYRSGKLPAGTGPQGPAGAQGPAGNDGAQGVPVGGTAGAFLKKVTAADFDTAWSDIDSLSNSLGADVTISVANTWYDGPTVTLGRGVYLVVGRLLTLRTTTTASFHYARLTDKTNHYCSSQGYTPSVANQSFSHPICALITSAGSKQIWIQGTMSQAGVIKAALSSNGAGNNASQIVAIKIGVN